MELSKVGGEGSETMAIAGFDPFQSDVEKGDGAVNELCRLWLGSRLEINKGR